MWLIIAAEPLDPSPKFQEYEYGKVPPADVPVKAVVTPMAGLLGEKVKLVDKGRGFPEPKISLNMYPPFAAAVSPCANGENQQLFSMDLSAALLSLEVLWATALH